MLNKKDQQMVNILSENYFKINLLMEEYYLAVVFGSITV